MTGTNTLAQESTIDRIFGTVVDAQTYRNMLYLALSYPLGVFYFTLLVTGFSIGLGLLVVMVGLPILLLVFAASNMFVGFERMLLANLLKVHLSPVAPAQPIPGWLDKLKAHFARPSTWKGIFYLLLRFPMGIVSLVLVLVTTASSVALLTAPLTYTWIPLNIGIGEITDFDQAMLCCAIGAIIALVGLHVINLWAAMWVKVAAALLR